MRWERRRGGVDERGSCSDARVVSTFGICFSHATTGLHASAVSIHDSCFLFPLLLIYPTRELCISAWTMVLCESRLECENRPCAQKPVLTRMTCMPCTRAILPCTKCSPSIQGNSTLIVRAAPNNSKHDRQLPLRWPIPQLRFPRGPMSTGVLP